MNRYNAALVLRALELIEPIPMLREMYGFEDVNVNALRTWHVAHTWVAFGCSPALFVQFALDPTRKPVAHDVCDDVVICLAWGKRAVDD